MTMQRVWPPITQKRSPKEVACPACQSPAGRLCTQPTDTTRKAVPWYHYARDEAANPGQVHQPTS